MRGSKYKLTSPVVDKVAADPVVTPGTGVSSSRKLSLCFEEYAKARTGYHHVSSFSNKMIANSGEGRSVIVATYSMLTCRLLCPPQKSRCLETGFWDCLRRILVTLRRDH